MTWFSYENISSEWRSSQWFECLCFQLIWRSGRTMCQYMYPVTHLLLWLSYSNCGSCYMHLTQGYDGFKTEGINWNPCFSVAVEVCVCWLFVYLFSETFVRDYVLGRVCTFYMHAELFSSLPQGTSLWCHGLMLGRHSLALSARVGLVWVSFPPGLWLVCF